MNDMDDILTEQQIEGVRSYGLAPVEGSLARVLDSHERLRARLAETERERADAQAALLCYATIYACPGQLIEPGVVSGCDGSADDCPTCAALASSGADSGKEERRDASS